MSRLSGPQVKQLQEALLSAFRLDELALLVRLELDERLDAIVSPGPLSNVAFELVMWAERNGRTRGLIEAVAAARPNNPALGELRGLLGPVPTEAPTSSAVDQQRRLRGVLLDQFPRPADLTILLADSLGADLSQVAGGANQTEVCFNVVRWLWVDKAGRLRPLLAQAVRERPNNGELKALQRELESD